MSRFPQVPYDLADKLKFKRFNSRKCYYYEDSNMYVLKSYNTIVAMFLKKTETMFYDSDPYSGFTGQHKGEFVRSIVKGNIGDVIFIPQIYLINFIRNTLEQKALSIKTNILFKVGEYVKLYRLHNQPTKTATIVRHSNSFDFVEGNGKDVCTITPVYYIVQRQCIGDIKSNNTLFCYSRNLKRLDCGI